MIYSIKTLPFYREVYTVDRQLWMYTVIKFDGFLNVENIYRVKRVRGGTLACDCPGNRFNKCKHRPVITNFEVTQRVNKRWFYDYDLDLWYLPITARV